jgi:tetratricopeptide (TPR) repeat protein
MRGLLIMRGIRFKIAAFALTAMAAGVTAITPARAEPVTDRILAGHQLSTRNGCTFLKINFHMRVQYKSHFPVDHGDQLRIKIKAIDPGRVLEAMSRREALRPPQNTPLNVQSIVFEPDGLEGPVLAVNFGRQVHYNVVPGRDFLSMIVAVSNNGSVRNCQPDYLFSGGVGWDTAVQAPGRPNETVIGRRAPGSVVAKSSGSSVVPKSSQQLTPSSKNWVTLQEEALDRPVPQDNAGVDTNTASADSALDKARSEMERRDYPGAIRTLTKALALKENIHTPQVQEMLGIAFQKNKQDGQAKQVYEDYLRRYPTGLVSDGIRQRLDGIVTAEKAASEPLREARDAPPPSAPEGSVKDGNGSGATYWTLSGSVSSFYVRNDSYRVVQDPSRPINVSVSAEDQQTHRDSLLSNTDVTATWGNNDYSTKLRFSGNQQHQFSETETAADTYGFATAYVENTIRSWGTLTRVGRQTSGNDGVLGRFDGGLAAWQASPWLRTQIVGGSPVEARVDSPFQNDRYFYGASIGIGRLWEGFDASFFAIENRDRNLVDRRAVGTEMRYVGNNMSAFLTVDYDIYFNELNAAIFNGNYTFPDKSNVRLGADYRKSPYLSAWTALQGQGYTTLHDMLKAYTRSQIDQIAVDRTATYTSGSIGYTRQISDKLQANFDFTTAKIDGTITSYGVEATPATGNEFFYSAQLVGTSIFTKDDVWTVGGRYGDLHESDNFAVDLSTRYAITPELRVTPRVLLGYQQGKTTDREEYSVLPTLLLDYFWRKDLNFEVEVGNKWSWETQANVNTQSTELYVTAGFRFDFYGDSKRGCYNFGTPCQ